MFVPHLCLGENNKKLYTKLYRQAFHTSEENT